MDHLQSGEGMHVHNDVMCILSLSLSLSLSLFRLQKVVSDYDLVIVSYDIVRNDIDFFSYVNSRTPWPSLSLF